MRIRLSTLALLTAVLIVGLVVHAQQKDPNAPADRPDWTISPLRVITAPAVTYFHTTFTTTFAEMNKIHPELEAMFKSIKEQNIDWFADDRAGQVMFIYKGVGPDRSQPFELSIGMTVPAGTKAAGKYKVSELPEFRCAAGLYNGGLQTIPAAYQKHYTDVFAAGHTPTDESREVYLYWDGEQGTNSVIWIQAGIQ